MNKKEVLEIKKLFTTDKCCISRICGCYVDGNKNKVTTFKDAFLSLPEEEEFKYFSIFRSSLSGTLGKNLLNMEFSSEAEEDGGTQDFLMKLRESGLDDDDMLEMFYNKVIDNYDCAENYLILLILGSYDIPKRTSDGMENDDISSEYVYQHILCSICPVKLSREGLCYNAATNSIENRTRDRIVQAPEHAFLFPAFNERNTDIHGLLYFSKSAENIQPGFIDGMLGLTTPMTSKGQKEVFSEILTESLGDSCNFETIKTIHENMAAFVDEKKEDPEPVSFDKADVKKVLEHSGVKNEKLESFDASFDETAGSRTSFMASNVVNPRSFDIKAPDVTVKVSPDRTDLVETREIDGRTYLMIELTDNVEVNGIQVKPL